MDNQIKFNPLDLSKRKILVTGASSGIGRATAIYLAKLGAQLVITGREAVRLQDTMQQLEGTNHIGITADLADVDSIVLLFDQAISDGIKLNGLVHCAGISYVMPLKNLTKKRLIECFTINYFSFIELCRQYSKSKYCDRGSIVGISSVAAEKADQCQTAYSAAKSAMDISAQSLSIELMKKGIRINTVLPGMIKTEIIQNSNDMVDLGKLEKTQLLGMGNPEDVAAACAFLISDMSKFITGRQLFVDGGRFL